MTVDGLIIRLAFPKWLLHLTERGREATRGYNETKVGHLSKLLHQ